MTRYSYFTILVERFTNHISAQNTSSMNMEWIEHKIMILKRSNKYQLFGNVITLKIFLLTTASVIHLFIGQKFFKTSFYTEPKITNCKDETINHWNIYLLFDLL